MTGEAVEIKGTSDGLVISLGPGPLDTVLAELEALLSSRASFFVGGRVALRVGDRALSVEQLEGIGALIAGHGVSLWAVDGDHPTTRVAARELGLETGLRREGARKGSPSISPSPVPEDTPSEEMFGIVEKGTLRSGQTIRHAGHITLIGDVNPGAELVAGGDVIVWGKLRGTVHAGAMGDENAIVCALELAPNQIRIGSRIARPPERGRSPRVPEVARVYQGQIVVERWNAKEQSGFGVGRWRLTTRDWGQRLGAFTRRES
jgi:septum site-determining protein MinC